MSKKYGHWCNKMRAIEHIRTTIEQDVFDYTQLMHVLSHYKKPRDVVSKLLRQGQIIRLRKGLYYFGTIWLRKTLSVEMLANLIYGPSAISLDYALSWYGLIPEQVTSLTSITMGRSRDFNTPLGNFNYKHLSEKRFAFGVTIHKSDTSQWLITQPLKALSDKIWTDKRFRPTSSASFTDYFYKDLRIDEETLWGYFKVSNLIELEQNYSTRKVSWMVEFLEKTMPGHYE